MANVADAAGKEKYPGWDHAISARDGYATPAPVGRFQANPFGLYDMHGNVWEWCADRAADDYYATSPVNDPSGPSSGNRTPRMSRGGSADFGPLYNRSAARWCMFPFSRSPNLGFRVARNP